MKNFFEANGLSIPTTFDELVEASQVLSDNGVLPLAVGAKDGWNAAFCI